MEIVKKDGGIETAKSEFLARVTAYLDKADSIEINSNESWSVADKMICEGQRIKAGVEEKVDPLVKELHKRHKDAVAFRAELLNPIESGSQLLVKKMQTFKTLHDKEQEARRERIEAELLAKQKENCLQQAKEMEGAGMPQEAIDAVINLGEEAVYVPTNELRSKTNFKIGWDIEITDEEAIPDIYTNRVIDMALIKSIVKKKKGNVKIPGVRIYQVEKTTRYKGR